MITSYDRIISTNLGNDKKASEMIASVIGQLSDGIWENSTKCKGYWMFADCNSRNSDIKISERFSTREYGSNSWISNPYIKMTDSQVKKYFAKKLKEIVITELRDKYEEEIASQIFGELYPMYCGAFYLKDYEEYKQKLDKYNAFIKEHPFISKGKFNDKNDNGISYLSYGESMTVSDVYKVYKILNQ